MKRLYSWQTRIGKFYIAEINGYFHPVFDDEPLGAYGTPQQAAEDLANGHTDFPSCGVDPSTLGISDDVTEWHRLP